jgi:diguanylate cyclase (GGDEF)-like protein
VNLPIGVAEGGDAARGFEDRHQGALARGGRGADGALPRQRAAEAAGQITDQARQLGRLVTLRHALTSELAPTETTLRAAAFHLSTALMNHYAGYDVAAELVQSRIAVARIAVDAGPIGDQLLAELTSLRAEADGGSLSADDFRARLFAIHAGIDRAADEAMAALRLSVTSLAGRVDVDTAIESVSLISDVLDAASNQDASIADAALASPEDHEAQVLRLAGAAAVHRRTQARLGELGSGALREAVAAVSKRPEIEVVEAAIAATLDPNAPAELVPSIANLDQLAKVASGALTRQRLLTDVLAETDAALEHAAMQLHQRALDSFHRSELVVGLMVLATLCWALINASLLSRPIRRLAKTVDVVRKGDLSAPTRRRHRAREVAVVEDALVDLIVNLRTVEQQARALADGRLAAPVLSRPVPGLLGRSLQDSVTRLSHSIAQERTLRGRLEHEATHDPLTGLPSRSAAMVHIDRMLNAACRSQTPVALLFIDLDDFKQANDGHGHAVGDEVLRKVASSIEAAVRGGDFVARLGGDEFVIVTADDSGGEGAIDLGRRIVEQIGAPMWVSDHRFVIGASVGVAIALDGRADGEQLLKHADVAVYRAKMKGKGRVEIFDEAMQRELEERAEIELALAEALTNDELEVHYQPIISARSGRAGGVEALVRWRRPEHGMVSPAAFIPIAELSGLIIDIGRVVLRKAACEVVRWTSDLGIEPIEVAVNISGRHMLSGTVIDDVNAALAVSGLDPRQLTLEITETVLLTDMPMVATQLEDLRAMGVRVAIDDFGTGYTSLSHLRHLPADVIKIDGSFVAHLDQPREATLVRLVNDLGHTLGLEVVAEGVETVEQRATLTELGCDMLQGYYFSRPLPAAAVRSWLIERNGAMVVERHSSR